jgi:hypothetical protein
MNAGTHYVVYWTFVNDHTWSKTFDSVEARDLFVNTTGLVSHPDIKKVMTCQGPGTEQFWKNC